MATADGFAVYICVISGCCILFILQVYGLLKFLSIRHLLIIQKRYPRLVVTEAIAAMFLVTVAFPAYWNYLTSASEIAIVHYIGRAVQSPTNHFLCNIEACRLWLMSFNLQYLHSSKNQQWKSQIDHSYGDKNWYLSHQQTYGSARYMFPRVMLFAALSAVVSATAFLYFDLESLFFAELLDGAFFMVPTASVLYCYFKCPRKDELEDNFLFHYEFRATTLFYCVCLTIYFCLTVLHFSMAHVPQLRLTLHNVILFVINTTALVLPSLLSTLWIPQKITSYGVWSRTNGTERVESSSSEPCGDSSPSVVRMNSAAGAAFAFPFPKSRPMDLLRSMLCDEHQCELFVQWMLREFSSESILCFIEYVQFKDWLLTQLGVDMSGKSDQHTQRTIKSVYKLYGDIPKSSIVRAGHVHASDKATARKSIAAALYMKYIARGSEFEVNISWGMRRKFAECNDANWEMEGEEMATVFDPLINEMWTLMMQSFYRFTKDADCS